MSQNKPARPWRTIMVEATQVVRELVAAFLEACGGWTTDYVVNIRNGTYDKAGIVQAAALAYQAGLIEGSRQIQKDKDK